jgi:hypothetical protein
MKKVKNTGWMRSTLEIGARRLRLGSEDGRRKDGSGESFAHAACSFKVWYCHNSYLPHI